VFNAPIRILILIATIALVGIITTQVYWVNKAISNENKQFQHGVQMALNNVVESLCEMGGNDIPSGNPIERISNNYFIVRTNNRIDLGAIEYLLQAELEKRAIVQDFEYGVYDCENRQMVHGDLVSISESSNVQKASSLPILKDEAYYFGVYFPDRSKGDFGELDFWKLSTALTIIVILSFGYGLFIILRQKRLGTIQKDFINNITHEFKTPLATLKIAAEVFQKAPSQDPVKLQQYGEIVSSETSRLEKQVNQLLRTSVLEKNLKLNKKKLNINLIIQHIAESFAKARSTEGLKVNLDLQPKLMVEGDEELLNAVFNNLMDNALKYGNGSINIKGTATQGKVTLRFEDDGPGIPREYRKKIFKKFFRIPEGDRHNVKGFGLGLFFVKKVLDQHGSKIAVTPDGKAFELTFKSYE